MAKKKAKKGRKPVKQKKAPPVRRRKQAAAGNGGKKRTKTDYDEVQKKHRAMSGDGDRFKVQNGDTDVRVLPRSMVAVEEGEATPLDYVHHMHFGIPQKDGSTKVARCCKGLVAGQTCPICDAIKDLKRSDDPEDQALAKEMRRSARGLFNILDLSQKASPASIQVLECGPELTGNIAKWLTPKWGDIHDIDNGRVMTIKKTPASESAKKRNEYDAEPSPDQSSARKLLEAIPEWEEQIDKLQERIPRIPSDEAYASLLAGDGWPESETNGKGKKKAGKAAKKPARTAGSSAAAMTEEALAEAGTEVETPKEEDPFGGEGDGGESCFGVDYSSRDDECKSCEQRQACKEAFVEAD